MQGALRLDQPLNVPDVLNVWIVFPPDDVTVPPVPR